MQPIKKWNVEKLIMSINIDVLNRDSNIKATVICDSINKQGVRITTIEAEYPRFIHSELMTHRMFSRNASSSRAVPLLKAIEQIESNMAAPLYWGVNQSGMVAGGELKDWSKCLLEWNCASIQSADSAVYLHSQGLHKQHAARLIEPFQMIKVLITATEWDNFFNLRIHPDAQPEICQLAYKIYLAMQNSEPMFLDAGEWHLPYVERYRSDIEGDFLHYYLDGEEITLEQAIRISASCSAQTSYRKHDTSIEKANDIFEKLVKADVVHSSPFEHLATPVNGGIDNQRGITRYSAKGPAQAWSGNLREWISYRHTMPHNTCNKFDFEKRMELFK